LVEVKTADAIAEYIATNNEDLLAKFPPKEENADKMDEEEVPKENIPDWRGSLNQQILAQLEEMGFSKNVREKALVMTGNSNMENAINWIGENSETPDFEDELVVTGVKESAPKKVLTPEEVKEAQKELVAKMKIIREAKEKASAIETEKLRMKMGKEMAIAKGKAEEQDMRLYVEQLKKQKIKDAADKAELLEKIEADKKARFGDKYVPPKEVKKTPQQGFDFLWDKMRKLYMGKNEEVKTCFSTIMIYLGNVRKDPTNPKFQKINTNNPAFKRRVGDVVGGNVILRNCGFGDADAEGFLNFNQTTSTAELEGWMVAINDRIKKLT